PAFTTSTSPTSSTSSPASRRKPLPLSASTATPSTSKTATGPTASASPSTPKPASFQQVRTTAATTAKSPVIDPPGARTSISPLDFFGWNCSKLSRRPTQIGRILRTVRSRSGSQGGSNGQNGGLHLRYVQWAAA